jgi:hypothetical protein
MPLTPTLRVHFRRRSIPRWIERAGLTSSDAPTGYASARRGTMPISVRMYRQRQSARTFTQTAARDHVVVTKRVGASPHAILSAMRELSERRVFHTTQDILKMASRLNDLQRARPDLAVGHVSSANGEIRKVSNTSLTRCGVLDRGAGVAAEGRIDDARALLEEMASSSDPLPAGPPPSGWDRSRLCD